MRKRSIHFLNLGTGNMTQLLPLPWGLIRAYGEADPRVAAAYEFERPIYLHSKIPEGMAQMEAPFIFAASCYMWNFHVAMKLMRTVKNRFPECLTVIGGPAAPEQVGDFFQRYPQIDVVVHGAGEVPFRAILVEQLEDRPDLDRVPSISYNRQGEAITTNPTIAVDSLLGDGRNTISDELLPSPYLNGYFDDMFLEIREHHRQLQGQVWVLWETNRGCPYRCTFCEWGHAARNKLRFFSMERLKAEIEYFAQHKVDGIYCADANFGIMPRDLQIAEELVRLNEETGYVGSFLTNYAKNSNERVFEISLMLAGRGMLRGTTFAMQSTDEQVLAAIKRKNPKNQADLNRRFRAAGIPTYVDLILPLPRETREGYLNGICNLLEAGFHDDIKVFPLSLLPNSELFHRETREEYGFKVVERPLNNIDPRDEVGVSEFVFETNTMSFDDYIDCFTFTNFVTVGLHNNGYTRFLSMFLNDEGLLPYRDFYVGFVEHITRSGDSWTGAQYKRLAGVLRRMRTDDTVSIGRLDNVYAHPDMLADVQPYMHGPTPKVSWWDEDWVWIKVSTNLDGFYSEVRDFLRHANVRDPRIADVLAFQRDVMLTVDYDPNQGKRCRYRWNWPAYFFEGAELIEADVDVRFTDVAMGAFHQHPLEAGNKAKFALAACGNYFPDGKPRRHWHQADRMYYAVDGGPEQPVDPKLMLQKLPPISESQGTQSVMVSTIAAMAPASRTKSERLKVL